MNFRTEIIPPESENKINHKDKVLFIGSCFTENVGNRFVKSGFDTNINPFGIIYNPLSICECLNRVAENKHFTEDELIKVGEFWKSYSHHGDFRSVNKEECLQMINSSIDNSHSFLSDARFVILTLGTAWTYWLKEESRLLANCHKLPSNLIERRLCDCETIVDSLVSSFELCRRKNPQLTFVLTISPIRHWKEGYRDNMLSKSVLHLAVEQFCKRTQAFIFHLMKS